MLTAGAERLKVENMTQTTAKSNAIYALTYFRQIYGGRVEINEAGETQVVTLTDEPLAVESLHLAWGRDGRHCPT